LEGNSVDQSLAAKAVQQALSSTEATVLQECDCCHDEFPIRAVEFVNGQMLCEKCRREQPTEGGGK
jgi:formylmethanofuran dehydrogenase subunit E